MLLAAPRGYCAGVDRAVITVEKALDLYGQNFEDAIRFSERTFYNTLGVAKMLMSKHVREVGYKVVITGEQHIESIEIDPAAIDPDEADLLADMITVAVNEAIDESQELAKQKLGGLTGGLNIPGLTG